MNLKEVAEKLLLEAWNKSNYSYIDQFIAPEMVLNTRNTSVSLSHLKVKQIISEWKTIFPDLHYEIIQAIAEEQYVSINSVLYGTPVKIWRNYEPSGKSMSVPHAFFFKFENDKVIELWEINDFSLLESQLR